MTDPSRLARGELLELPRYKTGVSPRLLEALASGTPTARLCSNENLFGASPRVYEAIGAVGGVNLYPDAECTALRSALGSHVDVDADRIVVSTGSENVMSAILHCVLSPGDRVVTLEPTFMLADILTSAIGAERVVVSYDDDLEFSADAVAREASGGAKLVYLANPNNPTGSALSPEELRTIVTATPPESLVVVDEAYYEYAKHHAGFESSLPVLESCGRPYVVLRTFSKAYGLAGLRVGYGICYHPDLVSLARRGSTVFDVGTASQAAALAALEDQAHMEQTVAATLSEKKRLLAALAQQGVRVFPSFGNFISLWFRKRSEAMELENALGTRAVFVKALPARSGEGVVRVTVGRKSDNDQFLDALASLA